MTNSKSCNLNHNGIVGRPIRCNLHSCSIHVHSCKTTSESKVFEEGAESLQLANAKSSSFDFLLGNLSLSKATLVREVERTR